MSTPLRITILGLSITSSWGNGHATTYRHLVRALAARGHDLWFLERDQPWYADNRDLPQPPYGRTFIYDRLEQLFDEFGDRVRQSDLTIVGSYVPEGIEVGRWVTTLAQGLTAFYDIDTPVTLSKLQRGDYEYLNPDLIPRYDLYLSFTGGPILQQLEQQFGSPCARPLYCSVDPDHYHPQNAPLEYDLGYMGTYSDDRQPGLDRLLLEPARKWQEGRFVVAGPQYPDHIVWPENVERVQHLAPREHCAFYNSQRFTLNITRRDMIRTGYAPSVRLFEAAACGTPVISDYWNGLDQFFTLGEELLVAYSPDEVLRYLREVTDDERRQMGLRARQRVLESHTADHRAMELESYLQEARARASRGVAKS